MIYVLALMAGLAGTTPAAGPVPAHVPVAAGVRQDITNAGNTSGEPSAIGMPQHLAPEFRSMATQTNDQLPPPCPPAYKLPLYGLMTLPVQQMGICNAHDWRPQWYNLTGP